LAGSIFAPHFGHTVFKHGTPLAWGTLVPQLGQTQSLGPPMPCLPPPLPLPRPLPLKSYPLFNIGDAEEYLNRFAHLLFRNFQIKTEDVV